MDHETTFVTDSHRVVSLQKGVRHESPRFLQIPYLRKTRKKLEADQESIWKGHK